MIRFEIRCVPCDKLMRYDADEYQKSGSMYWMCWECERTILTGDLTGAIEIPPQVKLE